MVGKPRVCSCSAKQQSLASDEQLAASLGSNDYKEPQCIALDGDKLKPREDQRKGGNGFGINEDGAGYTLTGVDRHGVAYETECYENHAQDSRVQGPIDTAPTQGSSNANSAGVSGNNPLVCFSKVSHPSAPNGEGERWDEREVAQTRNTFDNGEKRCQEVVVSTQGLDGYNKTLTGDVSPTVTAKRSDLHHVPGVISTNSNGEDVAATLTRDLAKQTGAQQQNGGGVLPN